MKNILPLTHYDEGQEARLQAALDVAREVGGHLPCLDVITHCSPPEPRFSNAGTTARTHAMVGGVRKAAEALAG
jgi:hypothetical protein